MQLRVRISFVSLLIMIWPKVLPTFSARFIEVKRNLRANFIVKYWDILNNKYSFKTNRWKDIIMIKTGWLIHSFFIRIKFIRIWASKFPIFKNKIRILLSFRSKNFRLDILHILNLNLDFYGNYQLIWKNFRALCASENFYNLNPLLSKFSILEGKK